MPAIFFLVARVQIFALISQAKNFFLVKTSALNPGRISTGGFSHNGIQTHAQTMS